MKAVNPFLWYKDRESLNLGGVSRYTIVYEKVDPCKDHIYLRLRNVEKTTIRTMYLLNGPFTLYAHVVPYNFSHKRQFNNVNDEGLEEVVFENEIQPGLSFNVKMFLNENSYMGDSADGLPKYQWSVDIIAQIVMRSQSVIEYELTIGDDLKGMKELNSGIFQRTFSSMAKDTSLSTEYEELPLNISVNDSLKVAKMTTEEIWSKPPKYPDKPIHLIILTHGIFSNVTGDMLYLKDNLESVALDNVVVRGYTKNVCKSEKGIRKLGTRLSSYIVTLIDEVENAGFKIDRISFIGHSLGGVVQLYAMKEILLTHGSDYFKRKDIEPYNLVCLTTPFLGVLSELNFFLSWILDMGALGRTGRDLTLLKNLPSFKICSRKNRADKNTFKPTLEVLPGDPLHDLLTQFKHLTLYANAINDGIVPLRTSALLYLDYEALGNVSRIKRQENLEEKLRRSNSLENMERSSGGKEVKAILPDSSSFELTRNPSKHKHHGHSKPRGSTKSKVKFRRVSKRKMNYIRKISTRGVDAHHDPRHVHTGQSQGPGSVSNIQRLESPLEEDRNSLALVDSASSKMFALPAKASAIESFFNVLICPCPSSEYIKDPKSRVNAIFHDRYYRLNDLRGMQQDQHEHRSFCSIVSTNPVFHYTAWKHSKQVKIAEKYHTPDLCWRKILVELPPDAHNNIVVRRRFSNGFGWSIIDHICIELFESQCT